MKYLTKARYTAAQNGDTAFEKALFAYAALAQTHPAACRQIAESLCLHDARITHMETAQGALKEWQITAKDVIVSENRDKVMRQEKMKELLAAYKKAPSDALLQRMKALGRETPRQFLCRGTDA